MLFGIIMELCMYGFVIEEVIDEIGDWFMFLVLFCIFKFIVILRF